MTDISENKAFTIVSKAQSPGSVRGMVARFSVTFSAESAHEIDNEAYRQNQTNPTTAESRSSPVKSAPTEQQKKNKQNNY
jgi:hypothetical protein